MLEGNSTCNPIIERYRDLDVPKSFRGDAAVAISGLYERLEAEGYRYAIRLPENNLPRHQVSHLEKRPVGRPSSQPIIRYHGFAYQAKSWSQPRRVIAKIELHMGQLYARINYVVTNLTRPPKRVVKFYNGRGTAEQWIKEGKYAVNWTRLSCHSFHANHVRLQLHVLAYNLSNFVRRIALPASVKHWTLTTLRDKLIKIGANTVRHAQYVTFQLAEVAIPRWLYRTILNRIRRFAAISPRAAPP